MSAYIANSQSSFKLPSLSYIDAKWEEPNLRTPATQSRPARKTGLAAWLYHKVAAFEAWRIERATAIELTSMSDRELLDIGLSRSDLRRVFTSSLSADLHGRGGPFLG